MTEKEKKDYCISLANTIFQSLFWSINMRVFMSWGVSEKTACFYKDMPGLILKVNGRLHKGQVLITYDEELDVFNVYLIKEKVQTQAWERIYADQLGEFIDEKIEKPANQSHDEYHSMAMADMAALLTQ